MKFWLFWCIFSLMLHIKTIIFTKCANMIYFENIIQNHYFNVCQKKTINLWCCLFLPIFYFQKPYVLYEKWFNMIYFTENISIWHMDLTWMLCYTCLDNQCSLWSPVPPLWCMRKALHNYWLLQLLPEVAISTGSVAAWSSLAFMSRTRLFLIRYFSISRTANHY